jgi:hypothetical protein
MFHQSTVTITVAGTPLSYAGLQPLVGCFGRRRALTHLLASSFGDAARTHPDVISAEVRLGEALIAAGDSLSAESLLRDAIASAGSAPFPLLAWQTADG